MGNFSSIFLAGQDYSDEPFTSRKERTRARENHVLQVACEWLTFRIERF